MQSLKHQLKKLDLSPPSQREDESKSAEFSNENAPAAESMSPLDLFIRDLGERKGKLPCCQDVTDIQTSVEKFVKALLLEVEKYLPFFKTTHKQWKLLRRNESRKTRRVRLFCSVGYWLFSIRGHSL